MDYEKLVGASSGSQEGMSNRVACVQMHIRTAVEMLSGMGGEGMGEVVEALEKAQNFLEKVGMKTEEVW